MQFLALLSTCFLVFKGAQPFYKSTVIDYTFFKESITLIAKAINSYRLSNNLDSFANNLTVEFVAEMKDPNGQSWFYADFSGENGFLVVSENCELALMETRGDISEIRDARTLSFEDNLFVINGEFYNYKESKPKDDDIVYGDPFLPNLRTYDGIIEYDNLLDFLSSEYDLTDNWVLDTSGKLEGLSSGRSSEGYLQSSDSVYCHYIDGIAYLEGNCGLTSTSNALSYYSRHQGFSDLPNYNDYILITPSVDEPEYMNTLGSLSDPYFPISASKSIHEIYSLEREIAKTMGYCGSGMNDTQTGASFEGAAESCGYDADFIPYLSNFSFSTIKDEIDLNRPVQLRTANDLHYGGHGMMITGYREYRANEWVRVTNNLSIYVSYYLPFVSVFDGHSSFERWFDFTSLSNLGSQYTRSTNQHIAKLIIQEDES